MALSQLPPRTPPERLRNIFARYRVFAVKNRQYRTGGLTLEHRIEMHGSSPRRLPISTIAMALALAGLGSSQFAAPALAQIGSITSVEWVGSTGGFATAVAVDGETVFAAIGAHIEVYGTSGPADVIGQTPPYSAPIRALAAKDGVVVAALGEEGLWIVDARVPSMPTKIGHLDLGGMVAGVAVTDGRAFATVLSRDASGPPAALVTIDLSDPSAPREIGRAQVLRLASGIDVDGSHAFVVSDFSLIIFDISGSTPVQVGRFSEISVIDVQGPRAVALNGGGNAVLSLDMTVPATPSLLGRLALPVRSGTLGQSAITLAGQGAFVSLIVSRKSRTQFPWLGAINLADPRRPTLAASAPFGGLAMAPSVGSTFVAADDLGLLRIGHDRAFGRALKPSAQTEQWLLPKAEQTVIHRDRAYLMGRDGIHIVDLNFPVLSVSGEMACKPTALAVEDDVMYFGTFTEEIGGIEAIDVKRPDSILPIGRAPVEGLFSEIVAKDKILYAVARVRDDRREDRDEYFYSLQILDARDPALITLLSKTALDGYVIDMFAQPPFIHVLVSEGGTSTLRIFDASEPRRPTQIASLTVPAARFIHVDGRTVFVAAAGLSPAIHVMDIVDPTQPKRIGIIPSPRQARILSMAGDGSLVAILQDTIGLQVFDFRDPLRPAVTSPWGFFNQVSSGLPDDRVSMGAGWVLTSSGGPGVRVDGNYYAYPTGQLGMLEHHYFRRSPWAAARDLDVVGSRTLVASQDSGLDAVDTRQLNLPRLVTPPIRPDLRVERVVVESEMAYTISQGSLTIIDVGLPDAWVVRSMLRPESMVATNSAAGFVHALAVGSDHVYVPVHHFDRVRMVSPPRVDAFDVTDPSAPRRVSSLPLTLGFGISDLAPLGRSLLVTAADGLRMIDVAAPEAPTIRWLAHPGETLGEVESFGDNAFVLGPNALQRISMNRAMPDTIIVSYSTEGQLPAPHGLTLSRHGWRRFAALITPNGEIHVWDVTLDRVPSLAISIPAMAWQPVDISLNGAALQILSDEGGLILLRLDFPPLAAPAHLAYLPLASLGP